MSSKWLEKQTRLEEEAALATAPLEEIMLEPAATPVAPSLPQGSMLKPKATDSEPEKPLVIELLPEPLHMHIVKPGGCKKWAFGGMKKWDDARSSGFYPEHLNVTIVAVAHVPLDEPEKEAAYYMDAAALGDYKYSGRIKWAIGYIHKDLEAGHIEKPIAPPPVAQKAVERQQKAAIKKDGFDPKFVKERLEETLKNGAHAFKETRQAFDPPIPCTVTLPKDIVKHDETGSYIWVQDCEARYRDRKLYDNRGLIIAETFEYKDVVCGRPEKSVENDLWFRIPMEYLTPDAEVFDTGDRFTWSEINIWQPIGKFLGSLKTKKRTK